MLWPWRPKSDKSPMAQFLLRVMNEQWDFQIKDVRKLQNDGIAVDCPGQQDIDKILERISNNPSLQEKIKAIHVRQNFPKCIVYGLEPEFTKEQMGEALSQSFGEDHKDLKVLFPIKGRTGKMHWVFKPPVTIYRQLRRRQKLTINWETHKVKEFLSARKCFTCQSLEHTASHCTAERTFCGFCTENHRITDCISRRRSCINCRKHNYKYKTNYRTDHASIDHTCPIYAAKIKSITKNTIY
ncbi:hypothetical protein AVEN_12840-1 [Araneus ventricosus]|uniref:Pre-C2HC domain-containing protein n=1 Tax=Araneus ventricosus TaxID=182803 RepID=A0A4Y2ECS0_ARAVE|nr:hypothetical protein AVEN_12840-1 [Araneus ventricosus]